MAPKTTSKAAGKPAVNAGKGSTAKISGSVPTNKNSDGKKK